MLKDKFDDNAVFLDINRPNRLCKNYFTDISNMHEKKSGGLKDKFNLAVKPLQLIERLVLSSSNINNIVLDPFLGSGTTALACKNLNRNFIGIEINQKYIDIANKRLEVR